MCIKHRWKLFSFVALAIALLIAGRWTTDTLLQAQTATLGTALHVKSMGITYKFTGGPKRLAIAQVAVVDELGNPVDGATVTGNWSGCFGYTDSAVTQTYVLSDGAVVEGRANIEADKSNSCQGKNGCTWTFTVTGISKEGMLYDPAANVKTTASLNCS